MNKKIIITTSILIAIYAIIVGNMTVKDERVKVIKVISPTQFYVDFNKNKIADTNELIQFYVINKEPKELTIPDRLKLEYVGTTYCEKLLLNKKIKILKATNNTPKAVLPNGKDYIEHLEEMGYVLTPKNSEMVKKNIESTNSLDLVAYNPISQKYHKVDCPYSQSSQLTKIVEKSALSESIQPCKHCFVEIQTKSNPKFVQTYKTDKITLYMTDFTRYNLPTNHCRTELCKSLLQEINTAKKTIDFAIYGIDKQPQITQALLNAQQRGVNIRWVYDTDEKGKTIYNDTLKLKKSLSNNRADINIIRQYLPNGKVARDSIMHNKFFIFDDEKVWTGSANISHTDLSGFNANSVILISSKKIAQMYKNEFEQMYAGQFHQLKSRQSKSFERMGNSKVSVHFSPQDKSIENAIIPLINRAQNYIYVPVFVITHKKFKESLINAKERGIDIKIIIDSTSAASKYSSVKELRAQGIKVKTENRAGKMHMKSIVIDDKYTIIGSMNFSNSGQNYNDENTIIIENCQLAKIFKENFLYLYNSIPEKWLYKNPSAESFDSINSCYDGIDNDFDGNIDNNDNRCKSKTQA